MHTKNLIVSFCYTMTYSCVLSFIVGILVVNDIVYTTGQITTEELKSIHARTNFLDLRDKIWNKLTNYSAYSCTKRRKNVADSLKFLEGCTMKMVYNGTCTASRCYEYFALNLCFSLYSELPIIRTCLFPQFCAD